MSNFFIHIIKEIERLFSAASSSTIVQQLKTDAENAGTELLTLADEDLGPIVSAIGTAALAALSGGASAALSAGFTAGLAAVEAAGKTIATTTLTTLVSSVVNTVNTASAAGTVTAAPAPTGA